MKTGPGRGYFHYMSMTITMSETGGIELPEAVRRYLKLTGPGQLEVECKEGAVSLRAQAAEESSGVPEARVERRNGRLVIVGSHVTTDEDVIAAIQAGRDEREERILAFRNKA